MIVECDIGETAYFAGPDTNDTGGSAADATSGPTGYAHLVGATVNAAPITAGITVSLLSEATWPPGCYQTAVAATLGNGFAAGSEYDIHVQATVDSETPVGVIGRLKVRAANSQTDDMITRVLLALPAAAADGAGGLPISDAGGLDLDTILARITGNVATAAKLTKYAQLLARSDAAIATDNATELTEINASGGSGAGDYSNQTEAIEALRDRGDSAWVTATGFALASAWTAARAGYLDELNAATDGNVAEIIKTVLLELSNRVNNSSLHDLLGIPDTAAHTALTDIVDGVWDEASTGHTDSGKAGAQVWTDIDAIDALVKASGDGDLAALWTRIQAISNAFGVTVSNFVSGSISSDAFAANAIDDDALAADTDVYEARVTLFVDTHNVTDRYAVGFFKNGAPVTSGITVPTLTVYLLNAAGTVLLNGVTLLQASTLGYYYYDSTTLSTAGLGYMAKVGATIDGSSRTMTCPVGRDRSA